MTDTIADMLNRIRNANAVLHETVDIPFSNLKYRIAEVLQDNGFVEKCEKKGKKTRKIIKITLKYSDGISAIQKITRISKLGKRIYVSKNEIKKVRAGKGISIISTSKGLLTDKQAREQKLGGEIICEVW
ncbi:MAG: 30S ribosomal protein S8 [Patescibacteria group bacterium]|nr:30S ribosomal protein S8 [Patescibacteria group bacterium]